MLSHAYVILGILQRPVIAHMLAISHYCLCCYRPLPSALGGLWIVGLLHEDAQSMESKSWTGHCKNKAEYESFFNALLLLFGLTKSKAYLLGTEILWPYSI